MNFPREFSEKSTFSPAGFCWKFRFPKSRKPSLEAIANKLGELGGNYDNSTVFICHGDCIEDAKYVENILKTKYGVKEVLINYTGAVIGSHSGPGTMAVFFLGDHR